MLDDRPPAPPEPTPTDAFVFLLTLLVCIGMAYGVIVCWWLSLESRAWLGGIGFVSMRVNLALARKMQESWRGRL